MKDMPEFHRLSKIQLPSVKNEKSYRSVKESSRKIRYFFLYEDQIFPIWMISLRKENLKIDFIPMMALSYIDPIDNLVGFTLVK